MQKRPSNDWHELFLTELAKTHSVVKAAAAAGIKRDTAYRHYRKDADFAARWDTAVKWKTGFLESMSRGANITMAARSVGISRRAAYKARKNDPEFAAEWEAALWEGLETMEGLALEHAIEHKNVSLLKFLITSTRARLGPDPLATPPGARPVEPLERALTYTDANGVERPVSDWQEGAA